MGVHAVALNLIDPLYVANPLGLTGRVSFLVPLHPSVKLFQPATTYMLGTRLLAFYKAHAAGMNVLERLQTSSFVPGTLSGGFLNTWILRKASVVSLCGLTAAQAIYYRRGFEVPFKWKQEVGSSPG